MVTCHILLFLLFGLVAVSTGQRCGGSINLPESGAVRTLTSPGYPNYYPHGSNCRWNLNTSSTSPKDNATHRYAPRILFAVDFLDIEDRSRGGCYDYVIIDNAVRLCGRRNATMMTFISANHSSSIFFYSDRSVRYFGFRIRVWVYTGCGGARVISRDMVAGTLAPPQFNGVRPPTQLSCRWTIINSRDTKLAFYLTGASASQCGSLWVSNSTRGISISFCNSRSFLFSASQATFTLLMPLNATRVPTYRLRYYGSNVPVTNHSHVSPTQCSFSKFIPVGSTLILRSPNWPGRYPHNLRCSITLSTSPFSTKNGSTGNISVPNKLYFFSDRFDIESHSDCMYDYFQVDNHKYCGTARSPLGILSSYSTARVRFVTDNSQSRAGYMFRVTSVNQVCGATFYYIRFGTTRYIRTPLYPSPYMNGVSCRWTIQTETSMGNSTYKFYVVAKGGYDLEPRNYGGCTYDLLRFNNGPRYCGKRTAPIAWVLPAQTVIQFESDGTRTHKGFDLAVSVIRCGGQLQLSSAVRQGRISNPVFPVFPNSNFSCFWTIHNTLLRRGIGLAVNVNSRAMGSFNGSSPCANFSLSARGMASRENVLLCGPGVYLRSVKTGSFVTIEFRYHQFHTLPPFEIIYKDFPMPSGNESDARCGNTNYEIKPNAYMNFITRGYPFARIHSFHCTWHFQTTRVNRIGSHVFPLVQYVLYVDIQSYDTGSNYNPSCSAAYFQIDQRPRLCGRSRTRRAYMVSTSSTSISFSSANNMYPSGFQMRIHSVMACGGLFYLGHQNKMLYPPSLPGIYPSDLRCVWQIHSNMSDYVYVAPRRVNYYSVCHNYNLYATASNSTRHLGDSMNLCLGRVSSFWSVRLRSPFLIHFSMKYASSVRPNFAVLLSITKPNTSPRPTYKTSTRNPNPTSTRYIPTKYPPIATPTTPKVVGTTAKERNSTPQLMTTTATPAKPNILGKWGPWTPWTNCSKTCGSGQQQRKRVCAGDTTKGTPVCMTTDGVLRGPVEIQRRSCNVAPCPAKPNMGKWDPWKPWTICSKTCGSGQQRRMRICAGNITNGNPPICVKTDGVLRGPVEIQSRSCNVAACPAKPYMGKWNPWMPWTTCSKTCGSGLQQRKRVCAGDKTKGTPICVKTDGVSKGPVETQSISCFLAGCPETENQKENAIVITFNGKFDLTKENFFKFMYPIIASNVRTVVNNFCNKDPGKCCKSDGKSYTKVGSDFKSFVTISGILATSDSPRKSASQLTVGLFVVPAQPNPLCSHIQPARRKKRATSDALLPKAVLQEAAKEIDRETLVKTIGTSLKKNLNLDVKLTVSFGEKTTKPPQTRSAGWTAPVAVIVSLIIAGLIGLAVFLFIRRYRNPANSFGNLEEEDSSHTNPVYSTFGVDTGGGSSNA